MESTPIWQRSWIWRILKSLNRKKISGTEQAIGSGAIGILESPVSEMEFLSALKAKLKLDCIKYTSLLNKKISKVALCGGSGRFLLSDAIQQNADIFISSDFKYHEFFDADNKIVIVDAGHYETEQFTKELIFDTLKEKFNNFACFLSEVNTNPINYL